MHQNVSRSPKSRHFCPSPARNFQIMIPAVQCYLSHMSAPHVPFWVWPQDISKQRWRCESGALRPKHRCRPHGSSAEWDLHCQTLTLLVLCPPLLQKGGSAGKDPKDRIQKLWFFFSLYQTRNDKFGMNSLAFWTTNYREKHPNNLSCYSFFLTGTRAELGHLQVMCWVYPFLIMWVYIPILLQWKS